MPVRVLTALALLSSAAHAERRVDNPLPTSCAYVMTLTDAGKAELAPFAATSVGGGLDGYRGGGFTARLQLDDNFVAVMDGSKVFAHRRVDTPTQVAQAERIGAFTLGLGIIPLRGKLAATDTTLVRLDVIATLGGGLAFVRAPGADRFTDHFALTAELTLRARPTSWLSIDLGIHDEIVPLGPAAAPAARSVMPPQGVELPPPMHELTVRFAVGVWIPDAGSGRRCVYRCW